MKIKYQKVKREKRKFNKSIIPNLFTMINMFFGFISIGLLINGEPVKAGWIILVAGAFDALDGKIARLLNIPSKFGTEFDSFADTISFCASPALLIYTVYVKGIDPIIGALISFIPLLFGTIRLARFNIEDFDKKSYFSGLPTPVNALILYGFMLFYHQINGTMGDPRLILVLMVLLSFLMISRLPFNKLPILSFRKGRVNNIRLVILTIIMFSLFFWRGLILFPFLLGYVIYNVISYIINNKLISSEIKKINN